MESERSPSRNRWHAVGLVASLTLSLLAADLWLGYRRMAFGDRAEQISRVHVPHPVLGWAPRPGTGRHARPGNYDVRYEIDSRGLRRVPGSAPAASRLWLFGDSFTFGHGVEDADTWASVLARDWLAPGLEVRNAGVMGFGLGQSVARLLERAPEIRPGDRVVLAPVSSALERSLRHFAHPSKYLFREQNGRIEVYPGWRDGKLVPLPFDTFGNRVRALLYNARFTGRGIQRIHHWLAPTRIDEESVELIGMASEVSAGRGARFAWLVLPHPRDCLRGALPAPASGLGSPDLLASFPSQPQEVAGIRFPDDPHWNARGHRIAARAVAVELLDSGVLDPGELRDDPRRVARRR